MAYGSSRKAILVFQDGAYIEGTGFGATAEHVGELVFNTSMTGYQEALTDPSYAGQILVFSYPLVGNYGFSPQASQSGRVWAEAAVVGEQCTNPHHYAGNMTFASFLEKQQVPGISGVDTRSLVRRIRDQGVQPAAVRVWDAFPEPDLEQEAKTLARKAKSYYYSAEEFVSRVSTREPAEFGPKREEKKVVVVDCGCKSAIVDNLLARNIRVVKVPYHSTAKAVLSHEPDGVLFSNGPGDPEVLKKTVQTCKEILGKKPLFGVCLGHQVLAQAMGGITYKLKFGHRGSNHAVADTRTGKVYITAQNHGYAVKDVPKKAEWLVNCLDGTNEGLLTEDAFSVQFHPEANPGPFDPNGLFDLFKQRL